MPVCRMGILSAIGSPHHAAHGFTHKPSIPSLSHSKCALGKHIQVDGPKMSYKRAPRLLPPRSMQQEFVVSSLEGTIEYAGTGVLWIVVGASCVLATWFMGQAFMDARDVVNRRKDRPKIEEELRRRKIEKLFGKK